MGGLLLLYPHHKGFTTEAVFWNDQDVAGRPSKFQRSFLRMFDVWVSQDAMREFLRMGQRTGEAPVFFLNLWALVEVFARTEHHVNYLTLVPYMRSDLWSMIWCTNDEEE